MKNLIKLAPGLVVIALTLVGCESADYSYNLTQNGCSTGDQKFSSKDDLCAGLKNDELNKNCAYSLRQEKYQTDCSTR